MQSSAKRINSYTIELTLKESGVELEKAKTQAIESIRKNGRVKGFQKGSNIPDAIIIREYGEEFITNQAIDSITNKLYPKALKKENIIPVAPGKITKIASTDPLEIIFEVETFPEITVDEKKLGKIKVKKTSVAVTSKEVDEEIDAIKQRFTHFHEAGHHAEDGADTSHTSVEQGDRVTITAQGYDKKGGDAIPETSVPTYPLVIGSGSFIPGFEEKLIGAKVGDDVAFDITFPKEYHSDDFKGRKVHFTAKIEKLEKPHTPEFTPEFIEKIRGEKTDLEGLKKILKNELTTKKEYEARAKDEDVLLKQMLEISEFEVGPELLKAEIDQVYREHAANLEQQGYNMKMYLEHIHKSEDMYKDEVVKPEAERRMKAELLLRKIREIRGIEADEAEVKAEVEKVIAQYSSEDVVKRLKEKLIPGDTYYEELKSRVTYRKVVDQFFE